MKRKTYLFLLLFAVLCTSNAWSNETKNPLSVVAEYNLNADGTFAQGDVIDAYGAYFKWADVETLNVPEGYHVPEKAELMVITGRFSMDDVPRPPYPFLSWKMDKEGDEEVMLFGEKMTLNSHYYGLGKNECFALRFKGGDNKYLSAYKWELVPMEGDKTMSRALKVTCRLLGAAGADVDVKSIATADYWITGNENDVVRYFPTAGYGNYTDGAQMDRNQLGRYWSLTPRNETKQGAWGFGFDSNIVIVYYWIASSAYNVRCFKNVTENTGVQQTLNNMQNFAAYFSPSTGMVHVNGIVAGDAIKLFNISGTCVMKQKATESNCTLGTAHLPNGIYFVEVNGQGKKIRVIK